MLGFVVEKSSLVRCRIYLWQYMIDNAETTINNEVYARSIGKVPIIEVVSDHIESSS
jgi:hypothetical protein